MRRIDDFVKDLREHGRTDQEIMSIASVTRWASQAEEIQKYLKDHKPEKKKKS